LSTTTLGKRAVTAIEKRSIKVAGWIFPIIIGVPNDRRGSVGASRRGTRLMAFGKDHRFKR
jgi:hypothetical protein